MNSMPVNRSERMPCLRESALPRTASAFGKVGEDARIHRVGKAQGYGMGIATSLLGAIMVMAGCTRAPDTAPPRAATAQPPPFEPMAFELTEHFGVEHPDQIVTFDLTRTVEPHGVAMLGPDGVPVPWQLLEGGRRLAVRTALAPGETRTWQLVDAREVEQDIADSAPETAVVLTETETYYQLANGLTGVRIPKPPESLSPTPAPVRAVQLRNGVWAPEDHPPELSRQAQAMDVRVLEEGPLTTVIEVEYRFAENDAYYRSRIELQAGQPSVLFEEEANTRASWSLELYSAVEPDQARYRGHHSRSVRDGYEEDGRQYRQWHERPSMDAFVDLTFDQPRSYRAIAVWDPWRFNTGWYWKMYSSSAADDANLAGIFAGRASRAVAAGGSGVGAYSRPAGVRDMASAVDAQGRIHAVFESDGAWWQVVVNPQLEPSTPIRIARGLVNPDLAVQPDGGVSIIAFDPAVNVFVEIEADGNTGFTPRALALDGVETVVIADPYVYQAIRADAHFLFFYGDRGNGAEGLLFSRAPGESAFTFRQAIGDLAYHRVINRPVFDALPDGRVALVTAERGGYAVLAEIAPGKFTFAEAPRHMRDGMRLNFGVVLDPATGTFVVGDQQGNLREYPAADTPVVAGPMLPVDHHGQGANRRSLATAPDGAALLLFGGSSGNEYRHNAYRKIDGEWQQWLNAAELDLAAARAHYHAPTGQFVVLGRRNGRLTVLNADPGAEQLEPVIELPETERRQAGYTVSVNPGGNAPRTRFQWAFFAGVKGDDLAPPLEVQSINRQMNLHGGFNLDKISRYRLELAEPPDGFGAMYMAPAPLERMIEKLRADGSGPHGRGFHTYLYNADPSIRPLIDMWVDESGERTRGQARHVADEARRILDLFVNNGGIYHMGVHYWHGGLAMSRLTVWIDQVLASDALDDELRAEVKAAAALFGYILWDNDFVPLHGGHGLNLGTANMPVQQTGYRHQYALLLHRHPDFGEHAAGVAEAALRDVHATINEHGAHMGSSHYLGASMGPLLNTLVQLKRAGVANYFADEPRLRRFAEFYMQFVTPPDPRYDNLRIRIPTGNAEANNPQFMAGVLGTAFADVDPELSARLMGSWVQSGSPHTGFHVSTLLMTDEELAQADPQLGNDTFPGFFSVLRSGWGEPHEAAAWMVGGRWYRDHRNHGEHGMVSIYAHAAPLALNWGPMYSPYAPSALLRNTLLPADSDWKAVPVPHEANVGDWSRSTLEAINATPVGGSARCTAQGFGAQWTRTVLLDEAGDGQPVFLIDDRFSGAPLVFSLAMACEEGVQTPDGERTPGEGFTLPVGVSRLDFTGQPLDKHPAGGIDWSLFVVGDTQHEGFLTEWQHGNRRGQHQVVLRLKGENAFRVIIVPWPKGQRPQHITVQRHDDGLTVEVDGQTVRIE